MPKVGIDIGHGSNTYPPSKGVKVGGELYAEHTFNASVAIELEKLLKVNGVDVYMAQKPFAQDVNLNNRTDAYEKQKVDMIYSIHANAGASSAKGVGVFYWHKNNNGEKLADLIMEEVRKEKLDVWGPGSRPSKVGDWTNFHMLRVPNKNIPAILGEFGFMTNPEDFKKIFQSKKYIQQIAEISAKAICRYFGITYKMMIQKTDNESVGVNTIKVKVDKLHTYTKPDWNAKEGAPIVNAGEVYTVKRKLDVDGFGMYELISGWYITANEKYVEIFEQKQEIQKKQKYIEVIAKDLWTYKTADWNNKAELVHAGEVFTVTKEKFVVGGGSMYQIKSGLFVTANEKYVKFYEK